MSDSTRNSAKGKNWIEILARITLVCYFSTGAIFALLWWYLMPKGFPISHPRFWVNSVLPPLVIISSLVAIFSAILKRDLILKCLAWCSASILLFAIISGKVIFPQSVSGLKLAFVSINLLIIFIFVGLSLWAMRKGLSPSPLIIFAILAGGLLGVLLPFSQRSMDSATKPNNSESLMSSLRSPANGMLPIHLSKMVFLHPNTGLVDIRSREINLKIYPLLSFISRSPDRFMTIFAPYSIHGRPGRSLKGLTKNSNEIIAQYKDDGISQLKVSKNKDLKGVTIESTSQIPNDIYSHLNSFCEIHISGKKNLALSFSPCPMLIDIKDSDYPFGRPARLAYVDSENIFHVVEAQSGEKGPFTEFAKGKLDKNKPLQISIFSDKKELCEITLYDWANQASRQLSPCAGWGLPENAIEFTLGRSPNSNEAVIFITLASTSVGRGWDSVGHAAGTYRNNMLIKMLDQSGNFEKPDSY